MTDFTYEPPDGAAFLHTLRRFLAARPETKPLAEKLTGSVVSFESSGTYGGRWNSYIATVRFRIPVERVPDIAERDRDRLLEAVNAVFPPEVGYDIRYITVAPFIEAPPDEETPAHRGADLARQTASLIEHDGLRFRSKTETRIYDALKKRAVLFFANATAVLGSKGEKKEPDFLICADGKWGVLEVMGEMFHPSATRDHERARGLKDYGLVCIEFYDASRCYRDPDGVVDDFLARLRRF